MSERVRNIAIGLTVIMALVILGAMVVFFAGMPEVFQGGYVLKMHFDGTHDLHVGDPVHMMGMRVGRVVDVRFADPDDPREGVIVTTRLKFDGSQQIDPRTGEPLELLPRDGSVTIPGRFYPTALFPEDLKNSIMQAMAGFGEFRDVATEALQNFGELSANLNAMIAPPAGDPNAAPGDPNAPSAAAGLHGTMARLDAALDAIATVLGDAENQENLRMALANLAEASASANEAMLALREFAASTQQSVQAIADPASEAVRHYDDLAQELIRTAEQSSAVMLSLNQAARRIEQGEGTIGQLVNNPELYDNLVEATHQLGELIREMRPLVRQWREEGILSTSEAPTE